MTSTASTAGTIGRIPVRNIWLLMLYASDLYQELPQEQRVAIEDAPDDLPNLVAEILTHAVERRMRRNLTFGYRRRHADLNRVRGRIDLLRTERRQLLKRGRVACSFDELTVDTPRNRFVKAALDLLSGIVSRQDLAHRCRVASASMERAGVTGDMLLERRRPRMLISRLGRLDSDDRQMLAAARLAFDLALPTEDVGASHLASPGRDEVWARRLFERAVGGFYAVVLSHKGWRVSTGRWIQWPVEQGSSGISDVLPSMQTDIALERRTVDNQADGRERIIIDTKFTSILKSGQYRNQTLSSGYIYQMYAYLRSQERAHDPRSLNSAGVLLYPATDCDVDESAMIQGHEIRFATADLAADTQTIRQQLLRIPYTSPLSTTMPARAITFHSEPTSTGPSPAPLDSGLRRNDD